MKRGDLVKYKKCHHGSLQHLLGLVIALQWCDAGDRPHAMFVIWNQDRNRGPANTVMFEFVEDLEVISESR